MHRRYNTGSDNINLQPATLGAQRRGKRSETREDLSRLVQYLREYREIRHYRLLQPTLRIRNGRYKRASTGYRHEYPSSQSRVFSQPHRTRLAVALPAISRSCEQQFRFDNRSGVLEVLRRCQNTNFSIRFVAKRRTTTGCWIIIAVGPFEGVTLGNS